MAFNTPVLDSGSLVRAVAHRPVQVTDLASWKTKHLWARLILKRFKTANDLGPLVWSKAMDHFNRNGAG